MNKLALITLLIAFFSSCTTSQTTCDAQNLAISIVTPVIASQLACSNQQAISTTLSQLASKTNFCATQPSPSPSPVNLQIKFKTASVQSLLCQSFSSAIAGAIVSNEIPSTWGCTNTSGITNGLTGVISAACATL